MGAIQAQGMVDLGVDLETAITWHLQHNHFPPVPVSMVPVCIEALDWCNDDEPNTLVDLPEGVTFKGRPQAPAWAIVEQHHLDPWVELELAIWRDIDEEGDDDDQ
jgi:hypothetical protein